MKKRILQVSVILLPLILLAIFAYTTANPVVVDKERLSVTVNDKKIYAPAGWTTGYNDNIPGEHIEALVDDDGNMRVAIGTISLDKEVTFRELGPDYTQAICEEILASDVEPINTPTLVNYDNYYRVEYQYNIENDLVYINFCIPIDSNVIYEILEIKPNEQTGKLRMEMLNAIIL